MLCISWYLYSLQIRQQLIAANQYRRQYLKCKIIWREKLLILISRVFKSMVNKDWRPFAYGGLASIAAEFGNWKFYSFLLLQSLVPEIWYLYLKYINIFVMYIYSIVKISVYLCIQAVHCITVFKMDTLKWIFMVIYYYKSRIMICKRGYFNLKSYSHFILLL